MKRVAVMMAAAVLFVLGMVAPAAAAECGGVTMPEKADVGGQALVLNGMGLREATIFSVNVYAAGLYIPSKTSKASEVISADVPKKLVLHFVRDVDRGKSVDAYKESFKKNAAGSYDALKPKIDRLLGWMTDISDGDKMVYTYVPDKGVTVEIKGQKKGTIEGADFAEAFFKIWFGDPPNKGLKSGLLGGSCG
jgi:hypothetical protein